MRTLFVLLLSVLALASCSKKTAEPAQPALAGTTWLVTMNVTGNTTTQNIFEFSTGGAFAWHPAGAPSYSGTWTQNGTAVTFTFKETTPTGGAYDWDNAGTLSADGTTLTGTMQRRGASGAGTFSATKL